jgi:hydrogenase expression/formation protein HypC
MELNRRPTRHVLVSRKKNNQMCLAIPGKVLEIQQDAFGVRMGKTNFGGVVKQICLEYTPDVQCGDYVLVHVGFALNKVDEAEAQRTYQVLEELKQLGELETPDLGANGFERNGSSP